MAILIAESGGSRTDWALLNEPNDVFRFHTIGMNPNFTPPSLLPHIIDIVASKVDVKSVSQLFFYGSGVTSEQNQTLISDLFTSKGLPNHIIKSDLDASAISLFGVDKAIVCILGTGSNAGVFDGHHFMKKAPSLGYLMGDYGSGFQIGKTLIWDFFYKKIPNELGDFIRLNHDQNQDLIAKIYRQEQPNRYIATFAKILSDFRNLEYTSEMVSKCLAQFIELQLTTLSDKFPDYPIGFTGSIAFEFQDLLEKELKKRSLSAKKVIKQPMDSLIEFHSK